MFRYIFQKGILWWKKHRFYGDNVNSFRYYICTNNRTCPRAVNVEVLSLFSFTFNTNKTEKCYFSYNEQGTFVSLSTGTFNSGWITLFLMKVKIAPNTFFLRLVGFGLAQPMLLKWSHDMAKHSSFYCHQVETDSSFFSSPLLNDSSLLQIFALLGLIVLPSVDGAISVDILSGTSRWCQFSFPPDGTTLVDPATVVSESFAHLAQVLRVDLALVGHI